MYYLKFDSLEQRTRFISYLKERGIQACFHYIPLHSSPADLHVLVLFLVRTKILQK